MRNTSDPRPETYRPVHEHELEYAVGHIDTSDNWRERRKLLLKTARVYDRLEDLIAGAKANQVSLAVFKPTRILDFFWEEDEREWDPNRVRQMREATQQYELFADNTWRETFKLIEKLPYSLSYRFQDAIGAPERAAGARLGSRRALLELPPVGEWQRTTGAGKGPLEVP